jgi:hypothetical protein
MARHAFAIQALRAIIKDEDWEKAEAYLDSTNPCSPLRRCLSFADFSHILAESDEAERYACINHAVVVNARHRS